MATNDPSGDGESGPDATVDGTGRGNLDVRERYVLYCLSEHGRMGLWDLADELTVWETATRLPDLPASAGRKVYLALYHTHVPRLQRAGFVEYEPDRDLVALSDAEVGVDRDEPPRPPGGADRVTFPYER